MTPDRDILRAKLDFLEQLSHPDVLVAGDSYIAGAFCRTVNSDKFFEQMRECLNRLDDGPGTITARLNFIGRFVVRKGLGSSFQAKPLELSLIEGYLELERLLFEEKERSEFYFKKSLSKAGKTVSADSVAMQEMREAGKTLKEIGDAFGVSYQDVQQRTLNRRKKK